MNKLTLIHAYSDDIEITKAPDRSAPKGYAYIIPDKANFIEIAKDRAQLEKERNEWMHRYNNLLQGVNYWKNRALEK